MIKWLTNGLMLLFSLMKLSKPPVIFAKFFLCTYTLVENYMYCSMIFRHLPV